MTDHSLNTLLILLVTLLVAGVGYYQVEIVQPRELQRIEEAQKATRLREAELEQLFVEEASSLELAQEMTRRWHARYKVIPAQLRTPDIIQYLESLSQTGFEQFEYKLTSRGATPDYRFYLFEVSGTAGYSSLYRFVWQLENNRFFYQIHDLDLSHTSVFKENQRTGLRKQFDQVNFAMKLKVFYAGTEGLSATQQAELEFPETLLPARELPHDSFYPIVRTDLPPNDEMLLNVEEAMLLSIAGERAIFKEKEIHHIVREGDKVFLGQIVKIDPLRGVVRASLNKGGVVETVDVSMDLDPLSRQARGSDTKLVPSGGT